MNSLKLDPPIFLVIIVICFLIIFGFPFAQIWAVNTLFKTGIEYSLLNWAAVMVLNSGISVVSYKGK
jgi:hypothetical protein